MVPILYVGLSSPVLSDDMDVLGYLQFGGVRKGSVGINNSGVHITRSGGLGYDRKSHRLGVPLGPQRASREKLLYSKE